MKSKLQTITSVKKQTDNDELLPGEEILTIKVLPERRFINEQPLGNKAWTCAYAISLCSQVKYS